MTVGACLCPHCGGEIAVTLAAPPATVAGPAAEEWLEPGKLAGRLGIGEQYARTLIRRGIAQDAPGCEKRGGRLFATVEAVRTMRNG